MVAATRENSRKAWAAADLLNRIGYFSGFFFHADDILKKCRDENELRWWYYQCWQRIMELDGVKK